MCSVQKMLTSLLLLLTIRSIGAECPRNYLNCGNNKCVEPQWICDGDDDCGNFEDERNCGNVTEKCNDFSCGSLCIPNEWRCDGARDCYDGSDEANCTKVDGCKNFTCSHFCQDTRMGPQCFCKDGYELDEKDNKTCNDIDECLYDGFCAHKCLNTVGSYECTCQDGYELINRTCKVKGADPLLIFSTFNEIRGLRLRSKKNVLLREENFTIVSIDVDPNNERIYLSTRSSLHSVKMDGTDFKTIMCNSLIFPEDIAVDYIAKNIYIADSGLKRILACNMKGTICYVFYEEKVENPRSIELDIDKGKMYWSDWSDNFSGIYSSGMDGSEKTSLVSNYTGWPNGIAIDHIKSTLYWADTKLKRIESIKLDGTARKVVANVAASDPYSLTMFEDTLYWSDWTAFSLESCDKFSCRKKTIVPRGNVTILGMKVYHPVLKQNISNPCASRNCSHMCLISPKKGFRCVCPYGFNLSTDMMTCKIATLCNSEKHFCAQTKRCIPVINICDGQFDCPDGSDERNCSGPKSRLIKTGDENSKFIFVSDGPTVYIQKMYNESVEHFNLSIDSAMITGLSYDSMSSSLFVVDENKPAICVVNLKSLDFRELITNGIVAPKDVAFDFLSNNLYWVDSNKGTVEVASVNNTLKRIVLLQNLARPVALAISPYSGLLFVATIGDEDCVSMYGMDGKDKKILPVQGLPMSLALHPSKTILYWTDPRAGLIAYVNYSSSRPPWILKTGIDGVMSMAVSTVDVFWTAQEGLHKIQERANLFRLSSQRNTHWKRVVYSEGKIYKGKSKCLIANGGCKYICLSSPNGRTCACSSGMTLAKNGMFCFGKKCEVNDFKCKGGQCIPANMRCDGVIECNDGSDEMDCNDQISEAFPSNKTRRIELEVVQKIAGN